MLLLLGRDLPVEPPDPHAANPVTTIAAGQTIRLLPEVATASRTAHIIWRGERYACNRDQLLTSSSPMGAAPD